MKMLNCQIRQIDLFITKLASARDLFLQTTKVCAAQSDQHLCHLLSGKLGTLTSYRESFNIL